MNATAMLTAVEPIRAAAVLAGLVRLAPIVSAKRTLATAPQTMLVARSTDRAATRPVTVATTPLNSTGPHRPVPERRWCGQRGEPDGHGDAHLGVRPWEHDHGRRGQQQQRLGGLTDVAGRRRDTAAPARRHDMPHRMVDPEHGDRAPYGTDRRADRDAEADDRRHQRSARPATVRAWLGCPRPHTAPERRSRRSRSRVRRATPRVRRPRSRPP